MLLRGVLEEALKLDTTSVVGRVDAFDVFQTFNEAEDVKILGNFAVGLNTGTCVFAMAKIPDVCGPHGRSVVGAAASDWLNVDLGGRGVGESCGDQVSKVLILLAAEVRHCLGHGLRHQGSSIFSRQRSHFVVTFVGGEGRGVAGRNG